MKVVLFIFLLAAPGVKAQLVDRTGIEVGGTADLHKYPLLFTRLSYSAPIGIMRFEGGGVILFGRDGGFGFDVLVSRPVATLEPLAGARFLVWEQSMSVGFPVGIRWNYPLGSAELTVGLTVAPTLHLTAEEQNTVIFDTFIGLRF
jgi:hypothetical protein